MQLRLNTKDTASSLLVEADGSSSVARAAREQLGSEFGAQWQRAARKIAKVMLAVRSRTEVCLDCTEPNLGQAEQAEQAEQAQGW